MFNNGTLLKGVLIPKLLNIPIACCSLINLDFLLSHVAQFDCIILPILSISNYFRVIIFSIFSAC